MRLLSSAALAAALIFGASAPASSETSSRAFSADDAVREAIAGNRDLQAARATIDVARGLRLQAGRLENPELEVAYADDFAFESAGERAASVGLAQRFPVTARLAREKDVASQGVAIAEAEVHDFVRRLIADVESAFYRVRTLDEQRVVNRQLTASVLEVEQATEGRFAAAEASAAEVGLLRIERLRLEQEGQRLKRDREIAAGSLARLMGRNPRDPLTPVGEIDPGPILLAAPPDSTTTASSARPDLDAASKQIERADADRRLAQAEAWEDWTVGFGYEFDRQVFDGPVATEEDSLLRFGLRVPLPLWNRQQGRVAAAAAELRRSRRSREALVLRIEEEVRAAESRVRTLRESVDAYIHQILPEATRTQALLERGYRQGLVGIAALLQAQRQYNESRAFYLDLLGDLRQAHIALEVAAGTSPYLNDPRVRGGSR